MDLLGLISILKEYSGLATAFSVIGGGFWAVMKFRERAREKRFETYHDLIDQLVNEQRNPDRTIKLDRQIGVIFELRNYPNYYPVTRRILAGLKESWINQPRALEEIEQTLTYISKNWLEKTWIKIRKI